MTTSPSTFAIIKLTWKVRLARLGFRLKLSEQELDCLLEACEGEPVLRPLMEEILKQRA